jgi:hypothetical protein
MLKKSLHLLMVAMLAGLALSGCVISEDDPCDGITCDGHGTCVEYEGEAMCDCDEGYKTSDDLIHCEPAGNTVSLTWSFPDASSCTSALINTVFVEFYDTSGLLDSLDVACADGGVDIDYVENGSYTIDLTAETTSGERHYFGSVDVTVADQDVDLGDIVLDPIGFILLYWQFPNQDDCSTVGVRDVYVMVDYQGTEIYDSGVLDCIDGGHEVGDFYLATDYDLTIECYCADDPRVLGYSYEATMQITNKGENEYPPLTMELQGTGCP